MKDVNEVVDSIREVQKIYTYKNVFKDFLLVTADWDEENHRFLDVYFNDAVEEYALPDFNKIVDCTWAVFSSSARHINFLLAVNDALNDEDQVMHKEMHDFIIEKFS